MRIAVLTAAAPAHVGAAGTAWWLGRGLAARGHALVDAGAGGPLDAAVVVGTGEIDEQLDRWAGRLPLVVHVVEADLGRLGDPGRRRRLRPHLVVTDDPRVAAAAGEELERPVRVYLAGAVDGPLPGGPVPPPVGGLPGDPSGPLALWCRPRPAPGDERLLAALVATGLPLAVAGPVADLDRSASPIAVGSPSQRRLDPLVAGASVVALGDCEHGDVHAVALAAGRPVLALDGTEAAREVHRSGAGWVLDDRADLAAIAAAVASDGALATRRAAAHFRTCRSWDRCAQRWESWLDEAAAGLAALSPGGAPRSSGSR